ncbi:MAG: hypothetical protein FWC34_11535 [Bacteroidetes bacterium]|nr:hypothetical protein [Bacteroidota bacterium]MCL2302192.1 hypothetical protein [Lentimicrobiaceae bacterium]MCL2302272.1 hypothetical protein [Lentimicrobiaceae bacterium]
MTAIRSKERRSGGGATQLCKFQTFAAVASVIPADIVIPSECSERGISNKK